MLQMISGCQLNYSDLLQEGYIFMHDRIAANVNAEKILPLFEDFLDMIREDRLFMFFEVPQDRGLIQSSEDGFLYEVYYLDNLKEEKIREILHDHGNVLINDGFTSFGIGSLDNHGEICKMGFNVVTLLNYGEAADSYRRIFHDNGIEEKEGMFLAVDIINSRNPGIRKTFSEGGKGVYDVLDELEKKGLYKADEREI